MGKAIKIPNGEDIKKLPGCAEAIAKKNVSALADLMLAVVTNDQGGVVLNEWGKIQFAIMINWVGVQLSDQDAGSLLQITARYIKPFEGVGTGSIIMSDPAPLKRAVQDFFTEVCR